MSNGRKHYKDTVNGPFKIAEKIKEQRKSNNKRKPRR